LPSFTPDEDEHVAQGAKVRRRFGARAELRLADDLDQGHSRAVQVDQRITADTVDVLSCVFLHVHARDADAARFAADLHVECPLRRERLLVLADLIALRKIGVKVVLAREDALS
jgi:hypothetical protein